jgi:hypothetical protein
MFELTLQRSGRDTHASVLFELLTVPSDTCVTETTRPAPVYTYNPRALWRRLVQSARSLAACTFPRCRATETSDLSFPRQWTDRLRA